MSSTSSDEIAANNVVYIGRASFRFEHGAQGAEEIERPGVGQVMEPPVTARIPRWAPPEQEQEDGELDQDLPPLARVARGPRCVVLPLWALSGLGALAFAAGLAVTAAAAPLAQRARRSAPQRTVVGEAQPQPKRTPPPSMIIVEPIARR